jgi:hypothetical protein
MTYAVNGKDMREKVNMIFLTPYPLKGGVEID